jgi:hypothetical protein
MTTLATKIDQFIKLRDHKAAMKKKFDEETSRFTQALEILENEILAGLQAQGAKNMKTDAGTAYINTQASASVKDRPEFEKWCIETGNEAAMDIRANKKIIRELLNEGVDVPGVQYSERVTIGVRRS